jgi:tetratricopeptide (TPR) repeat protein
MDFLMQQRLEDMFFEADALIKQGRITDAISILEAILIESPDFGKAYNHLGWIYETKYFEYQKALDHYRKCLVYSPQYTPVYTNMSVVLSTLGKFDEQEKLLKQALEVPGIDRAAMHNEKGIMHELSGQYDLAIQAFREAVRYTLVDANLEMYLKSIERCTRKKQVLQA